MSSKRKASTLAASANSPDSKRRKLPPIIPAETSEGTTIAGTPVLEHLKIARDKRGHLISTEFLTLPDKNEIPEYYQAIGLPIALDIIERKLKNHEYPTMTTFESDLKRLVANAKHFNEKSSDIHGDAEKIRKLVSNHMVKINPAYSNPDYTPFPTPVPEQDEPETKVTQEAEVPEDGGEEDAEGEIDDGEQGVDPAQEKKRPKMILHGPRSSKESPARGASSTPVTHGAEDAGGSFVGDSFQEAQDKLVTEIVDMTDDDGNSMAGPFINLPSRDLRDYYQVVKNPVSLKGVQKRVRGVKGREKPTGVTLFKSWQALEDEVQIIWNNARLYNEDGSAISDLAAELEAHFRGRLAEAKAAVSEPSQPKVTLRMSAKDPEPSTKVKLHLTSKSGTTETNGVMIDSAALKRQQELVAAGTNGHMRPVQDSATTSQSPVLSTKDLDGSARGRTSLPPATNGVKAEMHQSKSPAPTNLTRDASDGSGEGATTAQAGSMPPPSSTTPRIASASPHPQMVYRPTTPHVSTNPVDNRFRPAGKGASDALIQDVTVSTHPALSIAKHFSLSIPPSAKLSQQSVTINLPETHDFLRIAPTFASIPPTRQFVYFVTIGGHRLQPTSNEKDGNDPRHPIFDVRLNPGLNHIQVEMLSGLARGAPKVGSGSDVEYEKTSLFVNIIG